MAQTTLFSFGLKPLAHNYLRKCSVGFQPTHKKRQVEPKRCIFVPSFRAAPEGFCGAFSSVSLATERNFCLRTAFKLQPTLRVERCGKIVLVKNTNGR